jgi:hypothetical protein
MCNSLLISSLCSIFHFFVHIFIALFILKKSFSFEVLCFEIVKKITLILINLNINSRFEIFYDVLNNSYDLVKIKHNNIHCGRLLEKKFLTSLKNSLYMYWIQIHLNYFNRSFNLELFNIYIVWFWIKYIFILWLHSPLLD